MKNDYWIPISILLIISILTGYLTSALIRTQKELASVKNNQSSEVMSKLRGELGECSTKLLDAEARNERLAATCDNDWKALKEALRIEREEVERCNIVLSACEVRVGWVKE